MYLDKNISLDKVSIYFEDIQGIKEKLALFVG